MAGHENTYVIRFAAVLWQRLGSYMSCHLDDETLAVFESGQKARYGSGFVRYVTGSRRELGCILARLHTLTAECRDKQYPVLKTFGYPTTVIERTANQRLRLVDDVNIIPVPDEPEATDMDGGQEQKLPVAKYIVTPRDGFHWVERHSATAVRPVSPYTDPFIAQETADYLNQHVRWEAAQT